MQLHVGRCGDGKRRKLFRQLHQRLDALPRNLGFLHRVEQLRYLGRLDRQLGETGQERRKRRNIPRAPPGAQHVFGAEPQDEQHARFGHRQVQRRKSRLPYVAAHSGFLVGGQHVLVPLLARGLAAVNTIGRGVLGAVQRGGTQRTGSLFVGRTLALHGLFHPGGAHVGDRRKQQAEQRQPPVIHQQHDGIARQCHAGVKHFGREFAHALYAVVYVRDGLGHQLTRALCFQRGAALAHKIGVKNALHPAVDVVGKAANVKALEEPRSLHHQRDDHIGQHQHGHGRRGGAAAQNVSQALGQPPLKPRGGQQADVVHKARDRYQRQRQPFEAEVGADFVRLKIFVKLHRLHPSPQLL